MGCSNLFTTWNRVAPMAKSDDIFCNIRPVRGRTAAVFDLTVPDMLATPRPSSTVVVLDLIKRDVPDTQGQQLRTDTCDD